jgi:hypothetical protein
MPIFKTYNVAAILWLKFMEHVMLFLMINVLHFYIIIIIIIIIRYGCLLS